MAARGWIALVVVALAGATGAVANGRAAGAAGFNPNASTSSTSAKVKAAPKGPKGTAGFRGSGQRARREALPAIGAFDGPELAPVAAGSAPAQPPPFTESLIGWDTRSQVLDTAPPPTRMVALITNNGNQWCSGFLIGPDTLATAGHCVHPGGASSVWYAPSGLRVYPAYNPGSANPAPFGSCAVTSTMAPAGWTVGGDDQYDYAAMKLDCAVGNQTGWFGWWWQVKSLDGELSKIVGYPGDKSQQQWKSKDYVRFTDARRLFYGNDTAGGNSGSPVFRMRGEGDPLCSGACVMAVHAYGTYGGYPYLSYNHGTRVTQEVSDNFFLWRNS